MAAFIRSIRRVLSGPAEQFTECYVDDLIIRSSSLNNHYYHLQYVLNSIQTANMTLSLDKSNLLPHTLKFLGHIINPSGIYPDPEKLKAITTIPSPQNVKQLRRFMGMCEFFRRFVYNFSGLIAPLLVLLKKHQGWFWNDDLEKAFTAVKAKFMEVAFLHHPKVDVPFTVQTDCSGIALAGILYQEIDNQPYLISTHSRVLTACEKRYTTTEQELLAIISCLQKFKYFIFGTKFRILTDHKALTFLKSSKLLNNRLRRWIISLEEFDFEVIYIRGKDNVLPDLLSRCITGKDGIALEKRQKTDVRIMAVSNR